MQGLNRHARAYKKAAAWFRRPPVGNQAGIRGVAKVQSAFNAAREYLVFCIDTISSMVTYSSVLY